jgi:hypothetical protein
VVAPALGDTMIDSAVRMAHTAINAARTRLKPSLPLPVKPDICPFFSRNPKARGILATGISTGGIGSQSRPFNR